VGIAACGMTFAKDELLSAIFSVEYLLVRQSKQLPNDASVAVLKIAQEASEAAWVENLAFQSPSR
jgi:hypothetical protein